MIKPIILVLAVAAATVSTQTPSGCDTKADVTFLLDSSDNVGPQNFDKQLNFVKAVTNKLQIAPDKSQVSAVTFSSGVDNQFNLNQYTNKLNLESAIMNIPFKGGQSKVADGIRYVTSNSFSPMTGGRSDASHILVVLTNAPSGSIDVTKLAAQTARDNGVILYSVGVGGNADLNELKAIANDPDTRHMFTAQNYDALASLSDLLAIKLCNELAPDPSMLIAPAGGCLKKADLVFMVDSSSSVGSTNFHKIEHFLKDVVSKTDVSRTGVHVGLMKYGSYPSSEFPLTTYQTRPEVMKAIESMNFMGGGTNDADALTFTSNQMFSQNSGARPDVPRIAVMITDGGSANPAAAIAAADKARQQNIGIVAVGVGGQVNKATLEKIADQPSSSNAFMVNNFDGLDSIASQVVSQMCKVQSTVPSLTTSAPGGTLPPDPCQDKLSNCASYGQSACTGYRQWANDNCARFCGACTPLYTTGPPKCADKLHNCASYGRDTCSRLGSWAKDNCKLYCGLCGTDTTSTGYYGQCSYKGKAYRQGVKWYDGCDYECVCEDGNTGRYKCNNRCPVYYNLPTDCTLVSKEGECCLQPVCNFHPSVNTIDSSGHGVNANGIDVCQYKSKQYFQGQSWRDGCDYQCRCTNAKLGRYTCDDLCPKYGSIPPYCHLEQPAGECCQKPVCEFDQQSGSFQGYGSISGNGVGATPTQQPLCFDMITNCNSYGPSVCTSFRGWAEDNCKKYCNLCPNGMTGPDDNDRCIYNGKFYYQGQHWNTSCDTTCTCENAKYGYYRCASSCPTYNNIPNACQVRTKAGDCCPTLECNNGYFLSSSTNPGTIGNGGLVNVVNPPSGMTQVVPTLPSGEKPSPGTGGTGFTAPTLRGCLYKGQLYVQDQAWEDGCDYSCVCKDASNGLYSCSDRCPSYTTLPASCRLQTDPNDVCCKTPNCTADPATHKIPVPIPLFKPAYQTHNAVQPPSMVGTDTGYTVTVYFTRPGLTPAPPTGFAGAGTGGIGYCTFHGKHYKQGELWDDGCDFNCVCEDASKGKYRCVEKCVHYPALPAECHLEKDPSNPCCDIPLCVFPANYITHVGQLPTTPRPRGEFCVYEGKDYQQGQTWYDDCRYKCKCEDASNNIYRCLSRCPEYENVDPSCSFVADPTDPSCCVMPKCPVTGTTTNFTNVSPVPTPAPGGTFIGQGTGTGYCEYKGVHYGLGQTWQDGCNFNCECTDAATGLYRCSEICKRYVNLPPTCTLIDDFTNPCCKVPRCDFSATTAMYTGVGTPSPSPVSTAVPTPRPPGVSPPSGPTPAPHYKSCVYKGVQYQQGQTWTDGCSYNCRCDDADKGLYVCSERCAKFASVPAGCKMVTDPEDTCCVVPRCNVIAPTPGPTPGPGVSTMVPPTPFKIPTAAPGQIIGSANVPTPRPNPDGSTPAPSLNYCIYKGTQYTQGQKWDDGCEFTCECVDAHIGQYKCLEKCTKYVELPAQCRLARDPANPCCQVPECTGNPTPAPSGLPPTPMPGMVPTLAPAPSNVCVYKGKSYTQGQTWYDDCNYICNCEDAMSGLYRCNNRCPQYQALPAQCHFEPSATDPLCCKEPKCVFTPSKNSTSGYVPVPTPPPGVITGGVATPTPRPYPNPSAGPTPTPGPKVCVYKGSQYQQGQKWQDGCLYNCECLNAMTGQYRCTEMCAKYDKLPSGCKLVRDIYNPCCQKAYCDPTKVPTPKPTVTPQPGVSTFAPSPSPKATGCMYNGVLFKQGQQWNDGCDLRCICEDEMTGFYRCNDRCASYQVPKNCQLVTDPRDPCCKVPSCENVTPTPQWVPGMVPTPAPGYTYAPNKIPTPGPGLTYAPGQYPTWVPGMVPTPAPGVTYAPNKLPTPAPGRTYAPGLYPTWVPGMVPTPAPGVTYAPNKIPTPAPGRTYPPGQFPTYVPGMVPTPAPGYTYAPNKIPTPGPGLTYAPGQFPTYLPGMVPTPAPGVTYAPNKLPTPAPGRTYAPGQYPTWVPGMVPTPAPGVTYAPNKLPTPAPGRTYAPGLYPTWVPGMVPTPAPGVTYAPNKVPTPAPGRTYAPGQYPTWVPGMVPTPAPGVTYPPWAVPTPAPGQTYAPGNFPVPTARPYPTPGPGQTYPTLKPGMVPTPYPGSTYAPNLIPTPAPGSTYAPGKFPTWVPGMVPTPAPNATFAPWLIPTPAPGSTYAPFQYPTWVPGMVPTPAPGVTYAPDKVPTPAPGSTYYPGLYPTWVPGMVPTPAPGATYAPNKIPTPAPGQTYAPGQYPTYVPGMVPTPAPGATYAPNKIPTPAPGRTYAPGQYPTWVPGMVPTPAPGVTYAPNKLPTPAPGRTYAPGQYPTWVPGMVPTPAPGVTYAPNKLPTPAPGSTYAPGMFPTYVPGMVPTPAPGATYAPDKIPTPAPGQTYAPGQFPTYVPGMVPTPAPGVTYAPNKLPTPGPGRTYAPGQYPTWVPGMVPTPAPGVTYAPNKLPTPAPGRTYAPGLYPTWVPGMVPTPAPGVTYAPNKLPTPAPGRTYAPGQYPTWVPGMVPTPAPGVTYPPWAVPTPAPGQTYAPGNFPVPTARPYPTPGPGQTYPTLKPGMVPTPYPGSTYAPNLIPTPAPGSTYAPGKFPTWVPGMVPTPAPNATFAPWLIPTPAPGSTYAPFQYPTWVPGMVPTPAPGVTYAPDKIPTPAPGSTYYPGLYPTWVPGMVPTPAPGATYAPNKIPTPAPGQTYAPGQFPTYVPGMVPTPAPGATYAPDKIPTPAPGQTYAPGQYPTWVPGMVPTPAPGVTYAPNKLPTPAPGRTYAPGLYPTWVPGMVPTPAPGVTYAPNKLPTPAPGRTYAPGQYPTWVPGMVPTPAPGVTYPSWAVPTPAPGQTYAPGNFPVPTARPYPTPGPGQTYPTLKPGMVPTPYPGSTYAPNLIPTPAPGSTYAPGKFPTWVPGMVPTPAPNATFAPWLIPTPAPGSTYAPFQYPTWVPGMVPTPAPGVTYAPDKIPTPAPGSTYYPGLYPTWVPGMVPTPAPGATYAPNKIPTPAPGQTYAPGQFPTFVPGMVPTPAPGVTYAPNKLPTPGPGQTYAPGQYPTWVPGMVPTPAPGMTYAPNKLPTPAPGRTYAPGLYPTWVPGMVPTPAPGVTYAPNKLPTPAPGRTYAPGQYPTWVPGMVPTPAPGVTYAPNKIPTPAPGRTYPPGQYPTWVPGMVPTPAPGKTYAPNMVPTPAPGQTYAPGMFPTPQPTPFQVPTAVPGVILGTGVNGNRSACVYHGIVYRQGQKWQDGCQYDCECIDEHTGRYKCKERCPLYLNVPSYCRLVVDPRDPCCKTTICNPPTPTPVPNPTPSPQPTAAPIPGVSTQTPPLNPTPGSNPTPQPKVEVCTYMGKQYVQGQSWYDGCAQKCMCENGTTGFYRCFDRCASYPNIPSSCTLVADPQDPMCCKVPQCIPVPVPGATVPTGPPVVVTGVTGIISGGGDQTTPVPIPGVSTPAPRNVCVYGGRMYHQGQKWQDGCKYECTCDDAMTGRYVCKERCAKFPFVPPQCTMQRDPNDICCYVPKCDYNQTVPTPGPAVVPTPGPAGVSTMVPPTIPPTTPNPLTSFCVYNGVAFRQGQVWNDGCTKKCRCDDADKNIYTCFDRCPAFNKVNANCVMVADPSDPCCQIPKCTYIPTMAPTPKPSNGPTPAPGVSTPAPTAAPQPSPIPTAPVGVITGGPQPNPITGVVPNNLGYCEYKGKQYTKGQTWDDGCSYTCTCIDVNSGKYACTEKCPRYVQIPTYCRMVQDPIERCCKKPYCPGLTPTLPPTAGPTPAPGVSTLTPPKNPTPAPSSNPTPAPPKDVCIMNGKAHTQGQKWYDGCKQICVCDDGKTGAYSCTDRCATFQLQPNCVLVPDPRDPVCCQAPKCDGQNITGVVGTISGNGTPPTPTLGPTPAPGVSPTAGPTPPKVCVYKGKSYNQGQQWQDGCQYDCKCVDAMTGNFKCTDRCPRYPNLPASCTLTYDPTNPCCQKPTCNPQTPTPAPFGVSTLAPTANPFPTPSPSDFCVYQGVKLLQGQTFKQGCDKVCKCEDAKTGRITCNDRCPTYPVLQSGCTLVTDPQDVCCQIPSCTPAIPNPQNPGTSITGVTGTITGSNLPDNNPYPVPGGARNACIYNGKIYNQGQKWDDGCTYTCECIDSTTGLYRCTEKCPRYPTLPSYCTLVQDTVNTCCQKPYCPSNPNPTPAPNPVSGPTPQPGNVPTAAPKPSNVCVYKNGNVYQQGQQWFDGCSAKCRCEDASMGFYRCQDRCPAYASVPAGCTLKPDPNDPTCCEVPDCPIPTPGPGVAPTPGVVIVPNQPGGVITGYGPVPTPGPVPTSAPGVSTLSPPTPGPTPYPRTGCLYKGMVFQKGQKFDDGCDFECECLDDHTGKYSCVQKCQKYTSVPDKCVLIQDRNKPCCQVPFCDFTNPTPFPQGYPSPRPVQHPTARPGVQTVAPYLIPTLAPPNQPTPGPSGAPNPQPTPPGYCVFKGVYYTQGQTWFDGCNQKCRCEDVQRGYYTCDQRCRSYASLPATCQLRTDPKDACCLVPDCNQIPTPRPFTPTPGPAGVSTPAPIIVPTAISGSFTGNSGGNPVNVPFQPGTGITGSSSACVYKGKIYRQGQTWQDSCDYTCKCVDANRGQYSCTDRCPKYYYLPPQCYYKQSPTDSCCRVAECSTYQRPTTPSILTPGPGTGMTGANTPPSVVTVPVLDKCVYTDGTQYPKGATWQDGCRLNCECKNPAVTAFTCTARCPTYSGLPSFCTLVADPSDPCCKKPQCTLANGQTLQPVPGGSISGSATPPTSLNVIPVGTHEVITGSGRPSSTTGGSFAGRDRCIYKGSIYTQGQSWDDGCNYVCTCENSTTGMYKCVSKCPTYPPLPSYCKTLSVPGQCCRSISCDIPGYGTYNPVPQLVPTPAPTSGPGGVPPSGSTPDPQIILLPGGGSTTIGGTGYPGGGYYLPNASRPDVVGQLKDKCIYQNKLYNQGESWNDGCDYHCECLDSRTGYYECKPLCPVYNNLPSNQCYLVKADRQCCSTPMCYDPSIGQVVNPMTSSSVFPVVGTYMGGFTGFRPGYTIPGSSFTDGRRNACVYKGTIYRQGQTWDDGCDFSCECVDDTQGRYVCRAKCPSYTQIPPVCQLTSVANQCCKRLTCNSSPGVTTPSSISKPTPQAVTTPRQDSNCFDRINNCNEYGQQACSASYKAWATRNCPRYCNICQPTVTTAPPACADKLANCKDYGKSACSGIYEPWAKDNCRQFCGLCQNAITTSSPVVATTSDCVDKFADCQSLGAFYCKDSYKSWSMINCRKFCNFCGPQTSAAPQSTPSTTISPYSWQLLMKGVSGAPGDLYQLWHSNNTLNTGQPLASTLTSQFFGHYKPDTSNHWNDHCFDKIKVSIYNNGVEKANIIFNAQGADKNTWFDNSRIISSTWSDIKSATKNVFSMPGDPVRGREFYVSGQSHGCDASGWIMVSTKDTCDYEKGDQKPTFYYAPGTTQAHWGFTVPQTGDVFAIQGHPTCFPGQTTQSGLATAPSASCAYKGKQYSQGEFWQDACQYNCTCQDASIGYYRCTDLCPNYTNLPPGCHLIKKPGECCGTPDCNIQLNTVAPTNFTVIPSSACSYQGTYYGQDQTWNDGCRQTCTCTDASTGAYSCRTKCLNWNRLPSVCRLDDPPPGLCCQQPSCPSGATINIPNAYKVDYPSINGHHYQYV